MRSGKEGPTPRFEISKELMRSYSGHSFAIHSPTNKQLTLSIPPLSHLFINFCYLGDHVPTTATTLNSSGLASIKTDSPSTTDFLIAIPIPQLKNNKVITTCSNIAVPIAAMAINRSRK